MPSATPDRSPLLGCPFDCLDTQQVVDKIDAYRRGPRESHVITTVNVAILMMMRRDDALRRACMESDLVVADGMPLVWTSRWLSRRLPGRVGGCDLMQLLLERGQGLRVFLLGAKQEVLERLVARIRRHYPGIELVGFRNGYFSEADDAEVVRQIRDSQADLLLLGMPCPKKELWVWKHRQELATPAILGVGGSFDVLAGAVRRAPTWMQTSGLEWLWRLAQEPRKLWRRYLTTNVQFLALLPVALWQQWRGGGARA